MVAIPPNVVTTEDLLEWDRLKKEVAISSAQEMMLRKKIFGGYFPEPKEGTNSHPLAGGYVLKGTHNVNRKIDPVALVALNEQFVTAKIAVDDLVNYKPELAKSSYNELTAEQKHLFDQALIITPGSPQLEIVLPAKNKPKAVQ